MLAICVDTNEIFATEYFYGMACECGPILHTQGVLKLMLHTLDGDRKILPRF